MNKHVLNIKKGGNSISMIYAKNQENKAEKNIPKINFYENNHINIEQGLNNQNGPMINEDG